MNEPDDFGLEALLRHDVDPLPPPPGSWQTVRRRARRRRWAKVGLSVAAVAIVAAGAVPAVLAVRDNQDDQRVGVANGPHDSAVSPAPASPVPALAGFAPTSVSFIGPTDGFLFGPTDTAAAALAVTTDGGRTWQRVPAPPVDAEEAGMRFANSLDGFVFGKRYYVTMDAARHWTRERAPGRIVDLETMAGKVWALVRRANNPGSVELFAGTLADPTLRRVRAVPAMPDTVVDGDAIAVIEDSVDVIGGARTFWSTPDGSHWSAGTSPCATGSDSARVAAWSDTGVVMACGTRSAAGSETKQVFESTDGGASWSATAGQPGPTGRLTTLGAGTAADVILGTTGGGSQLTRDGGRNWQTPPTGGIPLGFVGFISNDHIVALPDRGSTDVAAFLMSIDTGHSWSVTPFPN